METQLVPSLPVAVVTSHLFSHLRGQTWGKYEILQEAHQEWTIADRANSHSSYFLYCVLPALLHYTVCTYRLLVVLSVGSLGVQAKMI